jgi:hypothetical protein
MNDKCILPPFPPFDHELRSRDRAFLRHLLLRWPKDGLTLGKVCRRTQGLRFLCRVTFTFSGLAGRDVDVNVSTATWQ